MGDDWVLCASGESVCTGAAAQQSSHPPLQPCLNASLVPEYSQYSSDSKGPAFAVLSLLAPPEAKEASRAPVHLTAVLDQSGSMGGSKLELVKATTDFMATQLTKSDMLSIVSYDSEVHDVMEMSNMTPENKVVAKSKIARIHPGSTTNLSGGLFRGVSQQLSIAKFAKESSVVRSIFLLTDGLPNVGISDPATMAEVVRGMQGDLGPNEKIGVHTFGFGSDHDPELLGKIAEGCGGTYHYIESQEQVPVVFGEALGGLLSMSCQNVEVTITPVAGSRLKRLKTNFKQEELPGGSIRVMVGDLFADERKDLVLEVELQPINGGSTAAAAQNDNNNDNADVEVLQVHVKYLDVIGCQVREASATLTVQRPSVVDEDSRVVSELVQFHKARIEASQALEDAQAQADRGNLEAARRQLGDMVSYLGRVQNSIKSSSTNVGDLASLQEEVRGTMEKFSDQATYQCLGKKRAFALSKSHFDQRSYAPSPSAAAYRTPKLENMSMTASAAVTAKYVSEPVHQIAGPPLHQQPVLPHTARPTPRRQHQQQPVRQGDHQSKPSSSPRGLANSLQRLFSGRSSKSKRPSPSSSLAQAQFTPQPEDEFDVDAILQCNNVGDISNNIGNADDAVQQQQQEILQGPIIASPSSD